MLPTVVLALNRDSTRLAFESVVAAYLGRAATRRVLAGTVRRGEGETMRAALWLCDLRGFTRLSDSFERQALIDMLHDYFGAMVGAVHKHGGDVLKFTGDGFLATFFGRIDCPECTAADDTANCVAALDAAAETQSALERLRSTRTTENAPWSNVGLGLHLGEVAFGNVGARDRLDFTVVGPAVNEVSRIEAMSRALDQSVVISTAFADALGPAKSRLVSLGRYALRGVRRPQELFTLDPDWLEGAPGDGSQPSEP